VYQQTITGIFLFYCVFGITCWTAFGDPVLTTSLPPRGPIGLFGCVNFYVSPSNISGFGNYRDTDQEFSWSQRTMVVSVVITVLSIIAVVEMNNLGRVVSLMGALLGCPLAFVFPPLIHNQIVLGNSNGWRKNCNHVVAGIGVLAMVGATLTTLATWKDGGERRR
jgi:proton-coupled amino acid transporter